MFSYADPQTTAPSPALSCPSAVKHKPAVTVLGNKNPYFVLVTPRQLLRHKKKGYAENSDKPLNKMKCPGKKMQVMSLSFNGLLLLFCSQPDHPEYLKSKEQTGFVFF